MPLKNVCTSWDNKVSCRVGYQIRPNSDQVSNADKKFDGSLTSGILKLFI